MSNDIIKKYYRSDRLPHIWCAGCGHGIITRAIVQAIDELKLDKKKVCIVSGIGCSSRAPGYLDFNTLHTLHGRALTFATGIKLAKPELTVIVITGDGDAAAIGGNHLIHTARRNIDITTIVFNNNIYGMTGGQYSPTTPTDRFTSTSPEGNIDNIFDLCELVKAAGASFIGRATAYNPKMLTNLTKKGIQNKGFSLIDAISMCPTFFGRKNKMGNAPAMLQHLKENSVDINIFKTQPNMDIANKIIVGELHNKPTPEYTEKYQKLINKLKD